MRSADNYQSIKTPEDLEEEDELRAIENSLLEEFDPECGDYKAYAAGCRREARIILEHRRKQRQMEEDQEGDNED